MMLDDRAFEEALFRGPDQVTESEDVRPAGLAGPRATVEAVQAIVRARFEQHATGVSIPSWQFPLLG